MSTRRRAKASEPWSQDIIQHRVYRRWCMKSMSDFVDEGRIFRSKKNLLLNNWSSWNKKCYKKVIVLWSIKSKCCWRKAKHMLMHSTHSSKEVSCRRSLMIQASEGHVTFRSTRWVKEKLSSKHLIHGDSILSRKA